MSKMNRTLTMLLLAIAAAAGACSKDKGTPPATNDVADGGAQPGEMPPEGRDAEPAETGPLPCLYDQGGAANRGCDPGEVCDLSAKPATCVPGIACDVDADCDPCSALPTPSNCGHGFHVVAFCDERHAAPGSTKRGTCTRSRAPCEPCASDDDCGRTHPILGGQASKCLDYAGGGRFCGRACTSRCPDGFTCDPTDGQCRRASCGDEPLFCPAKSASMSTQACAGTDQICRGEECPGTGGARCATNDQPGALGVCLGFCATNADCPSDKPVCNPSNGLCVAGCTPGSCANGETCHLDGFCHPPCDEDADCESRFGTGTYCNEAGHPPPRYFKAHRDANACAPLGCETQVDCAVPGVVCDTTQSPPACVEGCASSTDCLAGEVCKTPVGGRAESYSREACRALPDRNGSGELGVCCNPGCTDRALQCGINEFCCGEVGSPYETAGSCPVASSPEATPIAPGMCFDMPAEPWCHVCRTPNDCASGYTRGFNVDPQINGGQPFQEQEWCVQLAQGLGICSVTCNPDLDDNQCPRGWSCKAFTPMCLSDADCGGLECVGENAAVDPPIPGQCKCGSGGAPAAACPSEFASLAAPVVNPRCVALGAPMGDMVCVASYHCAPPGLTVNPQTQETNYPAACGF